MSVLFPFLCAWVSIGMLMSSWHKEPVGRVLAPQLVWSQSWGTPTFLRGRACISFSKMRVRSRRQAVDHHDLSVSSTSLPTIWALSDERSASYVNL